jgi:hypothetical protein
MIPAAPALAPAPSKGPVVPKMPAFKQAVISGSFESLWAEQVAPLISSEKAAVVGQATFTLVQKEVEAEQQANQHKAAISQLKAALVNALWGEQQNQAEIKKLTAQEAVKPEKIEASLAKVKESFTHEYTSHMTDEQKEAAVGLQRAHNTKVAQEALAAAENLRSGCIAIKSLASLKVRLLSLMKTPTPPLPHRHGLMIKNSKGIS